MTTVSQTDNTSVPLLQEAEAHVSRKRPATMELQRRQPITRPKLRRVESDAGNTHFQTGHARISSGSSEWGANKPASAPILAAPVFTPSEEEFRDFHRFLRSIERKAAAYGMCRVVPPKSFDPGFKCPAVPFPCNVQTLSNQSEAGAQLSSEPLPEQLDVKAFVNRAQQLDVGLVSSGSPNYGAGDADPADVEAKYWCHVTTNKGGKTLYASDAPVPLHQEQKDEKNEKNEWNLHTLPKLRGGILRYTGMDIPGVTRPYAYIGSRFSSFCWHVEDDFLYSINLVYRGAPKTWYSVPASDHALIEAAYARLFPGAAARQPLARKTTLLNPKTLASEGVRVYRTVQRAGEFVITFPRAYHSGFNHGINFAEAVNFADDAWFRVGGASVRARRARRQTPIMPFDEVVCKAAESFWTGNARNRFEAFQALCLDERRSRGEFRQRFPAVKRHQDTAAFRETTLCYCDRCKAYLHLSFVKVPETSDDDDSGAMLCLDCARSVWPPGEAPATAQCVLHHSDTNLRAKVTVLRRAAGAMSPIANQT